ncbi:hypothetical protein LSH36_15g14048 [Paralvinella palmiformis]|uniref:G-protein coupled receptors family 1 profile domain-containing protein n=1 Tax=Paralvinella palmiformis TaxID=53620 RepID=A0AAD9KCI1_9ANNE|nr:hypothetical protein LSH36_15g14048 [Paralvinella palmiformis]
MHWNTSSSEDAERLVDEYGNTGSFFLSSRSLGATPSNDYVDADNVTWPFPNTATNGYWDSWLEMNVRWSWSDRASYVFGALSLGIASVGLILNIVVIFSITHSRQLRSQVANVLLCNLAVGSLMACTIMIVVEVPVRLLCGMRIASHHQSTCNIVGFLTSVLVIGTVWTVVALSVDKCRSIDSPLRHSHLVNKVKMAAYFLSIWATAAVLSSFPMLLGRSYVFQPAEGTCALEYESSSGRWYVLLYLLVTRYIPGVIVCFCHWRIFAIARVQSRRMATMVHLVTLIQVPLLNGRMAPQHLSPQGRRAIYTTSIFVGTFILCYLPHSLVSTVRIFSSILTDDQIITSIAVLLERSAFAVNIFIYGCRNRMVRDSFSKYVRRKLLEHASALQWKRDRHRRQSSVRSAARGQRPNSPGDDLDYHPVALSPTLSHPTLHKSYFSPVLPRAVSLDIDLDEKSEKRARSISFSCRELDKLKTWIRSGNSLVWRGIDPERDRPSEAVFVANSDDSRMRRDPDDEDCLDVSVSVPSGNLTPVDVDKILVTSNGLLPFSSRNTSFVALKESVV